MKKELAPIILFVYNRPEHTKKTLEALANNLLANESVLYIYCDGVPKNATEELKNNNTLVKKVIREQQWCKEVIIVEAESNKGLANSIINGVTDIVNKHGEVIVLEDDLITGKYFLEYMNTALKKYSSSKNVVQISGFCYEPPKIKSNKSSYFLPLTTTWGWATWKEEWNAIDFDCKDYILLKQNKKLAYQFNFNGSYNFKKMFFQQMEQNKISSWGIRYYWNVFKQKALILHPDKSLVLNNGWDNSGKHKDSYQIYPIENWDEDYRVVKFPEVCKLDSLTVKFVSKYIKKRTSFFSKLINRLLNF